MGDATTGPRMSASVRSRSPKSSHAPASPPTGEATTSAPIEVDDVVDDGLSIDDQISTYTASLSPSVVDYPTEYGRRYHAYRAGTYQFPNDEREIERLDLIHTLHVKTIGNKLFLAPIEADKTHRILDIGTGTGSWAIDVGDLLPNAEVIGNDLSPIQPGWVPPNVKFEIDDVESPWVGSLKYDFVFSRYMAASIKDWPRYVGQIYEGLNSGGWAEFQDYDFMLESEDDSLKNTETFQWNTNMMRAFGIIGREAKPGPKLESWVREAGFQNIYYQRFKIPLGPWARDPALKDLGMCNLVQTLDGIEGFTLKMFCGVLGWGTEEVAVFLARVRKEMKAGKFHSHLN
ncbi:Malonyl-[acyl-carrier protein] O-methyltransferase 1-like protein 4 [Colletotrichum chlorophyti]|uniref:Malonyl-[acyl-carrier protein] O-methyltransferase 1-like protein 4 n=1 Tax=Colletotrichum chlorophyti TaxID=708187 RepID=A0A1Q8RPK9_9PEZI|nr:Malonyl-[acyl-carrier protein] O-methyltransferase 1-like protein 4 [Colletotrichum chlorophyti]